MIYSEWFGGVSFDEEVTVFGNNLIAGELPANELTQRIIDEGGIFVYVRRGFLGEPNAFLVTPTGFDFGEVVLGTTSPPQMVEITNVSGVAQTFSGVGGAAGVFGGSQNCQGRTLEPGESCQFTYRFTPTEEGDTSGSTSGSINGEPFSFDFRGIGIADAANSVRLLPAVQFFGESLYTLDFYVSQPSVITLTLFEHNNMPDAEDIVPAIRANSQFRYVLVPPGVPVAASMAENVWWDYEAVAEHYGIPDR